MKKILAACRENWGIPINLMFAILNASLVPGSWAKGNGWLVSFGVLVTALNLLCAVWLTKQELSREAEA